MKTIIFQEYKTTLLTLLHLFLSILPCSAQRAKYNFNGAWQLHYPMQSIEHPGETRTVTLPRAWNEDYAYRVGIAQLPDDTCRYTKMFDVPTQWTGKRIFIEFEGARQAAVVTLNGKKVGSSQNGVMAFGFDLTPYIIYGGTNRIEVLTDNSWSYREQGDGTIGGGTPYQWNNKNFNMNMGGLPKNVWLHITDNIYQTLPLMSNLGTTGVYIYGSDYDIAKKKVTANIETQVINASTHDERVTLHVEVLDNEGKRVAQMSGQPTVIAAGDTVTLSTKKRLSNVHFWSWGYGYLYTVKTSLSFHSDKKSRKDEVVTRTGFRKTHYGEGKIWLNDRCMMVHGYAQRTSNEWPAVGTNIPAWLSDYSNNLMVTSGANVVRWMHVTPSKQDIESCDRVGLIQAMPAGDAEKDVEGRQWMQRAELMRDAIVYNRNNPSILFYEGGNESISREHLLELKHLRNLYDPHGGRAVGSREMLDINESEYGGEMLYINKSKKHPLWAMEYCRDEGYRMYWDDHSYPYHRHGAGPLYRKADATIYNQNQDQLAIEMIRRWHDYYMVRPGMGQRVSSGGVKIVFSDTNTHGRSEMNYRTSGVVDAMRIEKDAFYAHQVMWNSWVDVEHKASHIIGHWNYNEGTIKDVYVVSTSPIVELFVNGKSVGRSTQAEYSFLHTFKDVKWEKGEVKAVGYANDGETTESTASHQTAGTPHHLQLTLIQNPDGGMHADGSDLALVQVEVMDKEGRRCPLDNRYIHWTLEGEGEWRGGIGKSPDGDNYILARSLPVEAGVSRVLVRSTCTPGTILLKAYAKDMKEATIEWKTTAVGKNITEGISDYIAAEHLKVQLSRGETPRSPSYTEKKTTHPVIAATAGANTTTIGNCWDDNELSEWRNDGKLATAWITFELSEPAAIDEISIKLTGWRKRSYPLEVVAKTDEGKEQVVWKGYTEKSLGYVSLFIDNPVKARYYTIRQTGKATEKDAFGAITELAGGAATELDLYKMPGAEQVKGELRIVEIDFISGK